MSNRVFAVFVVALMVSAIAMSLFAYIVHSDIANLEQQLDQLRHERKFDQLMTKDIMERQDEVVRELLKLKKGVQQ